MFDFTFTKNPLYNEEPLINFLNTIAKNPGCYEEVLLKYYEELFELIQKFGIGMLIFPRAVHQLQGTYSVTSVES